MILCKPFSVIFGCKTLCLPGTTPPQIYAGVPELTEQEFSKNFAPLIIYLIGLGVLVHRVDWFAESIALCVENVR